MVYLSENSPVAIVSQSSDRAQSRQQFPGATQPETQQSRPLGNLIPNEEQHPNEDFLPTEHKERKKEMRICARMKLSDPGRKHLESDSQLIA